MFDDIRPTRFALIFLFLILSMASPDFADAKPFSEREIKVTRDPFNNPLPTRAEYLQQFPQSVLDVLAIRKSPQLRDDSGTIVIFANSGLYEQTEDLISQYLEYLEDEENSTVLIVLQGGTAEEMKSMLLEEGGDDLIGTVMMGELPLAWFENYEYFDNEDEPDNNRLVEYPIDLFFMDIDGEWQDTSGNEIYDVHEGANRSPDIWLGRLPGYNLNHVNEDTLIANYLRRAHDYRNGELNLDHRALNYVDDDWEYAARDWDDDIFRAWGGVFTEARPDTTSAGRYTSYLNYDEFELIQVAVHSTTDSHIFKINDGHTNDYFRFRNLRDDVIPNALFYNLFACSVMNIARPLCMGALYALRGPVGLGAVGSTKTGSMLYFEDYYQPLREGATFGEAFQRWFAIHAHEEGSENWARSWFYGMTYFGDPTLKIRLGIRAVEYIIEDELEGDGDGFPDAGEICGVSFLMINLGTESFHNGLIELIPPEDKLSFQNRELRFSVEPDEFELTDGVRMTISNQLNDKQEVRLGMQISEQEGDTWYDRVDFDIRSPLLEVTHYQQSDLGGNTNGWTEPGESGRLVFRVLNSGRDNARAGGELWITSLDSLVTPTEALVDIPDLQVDASCNASPWEYSVAEDADQQSGLLLKTVLLSGDVQRGSNLILLACSPDFHFGDSLSQEPLWMNHYPVNLTYSDCWNWSKSFGETSGGLAFTTEDSVYPNNCDSALELPMMMLEADAELILRHRMSAEERYDGGIVEVMRDNGWVKADPEGGYNGISVNNGSFPGGACWNGEFGWTFSRIPLENDAGSVRIRLRFGSDEIESREGWFIDSISIDGLPYSVSESQPHPVEFGITRLYPNPFNSRLNISYSIPQAGYVRLVIFDVHGRAAGTLFEGVKDSGTHEISLSGQSLSTGLYFVYLDLGNLSSIAKVALVK